MLTGRQIEQLQEALLDAFASHGALRMLARIELEQNLDAIAGGENLRVLVFNLISWAEQTGAVAQLIEGACRQNAGNPKLRDLQRAAKAWQGAVFWPCTARAHGAARHGRCLPELQPAGSHTDAPYPRCVARGRLFGLDR